MSLEGAEALGSWKETEGQQEGRDMGKGGGPDRNGALISSQLECRSFKILKGR